MTYQETMDTIRELRVGGMEDITEWMEDFDGVMPWREAAAEYVYRVTGYKDVEELMREIDY